MSLPITSGPWTGSAQRAQPRPVPSLGRRLRRGPPREPAEAPGQRRQEAEREGEHAERGHGRQPARDARLLLALEKLAVVDERAGEGLLRRHLGGGDGGVLGHVDGEAENLAAALEPDRGLPVAVDRDRLRGAVDAVAAGGEPVDDQAVALPRGEVEPGGILGSLEGDRCGPRRRPRAPGRAVGCGASPGPGRFRARWSTARRRTRPRSRAGRRRGRFAPPRGAAGDRAGRSRAARRPGRLRAAATIAPISASGRRSEVQGNGIAIWDQPHSAAKPTVPIPRPEAAPRARGRRASARPASSTQAASAR